jgi:hypothetical protein
MRILMLLITLPLMTALLTGCDPAAPAATPTPGPPPATATNPPAAPTTVVPTATAQPAPPTPIVPTATVAPVSTASPAPATPTAPLPEGGWTQIMTDNGGPAPRYDHSALVDPVRQQIVVFGGRGPRTFGDTWIFELGARRWREVPGPGPAPRFGHGVAYDAAHRRMLLVMGEGAGFFNDAWAFDLDQETWTELKASRIADDEPRPRYGQSAALDSQGRVFISHGFSDQGRFDDTWVFDPAAARWINITPATGPKPLKRCLHEIVYDATGDRMFLYGGCSSGFGPCPQGDLWAFDMQARAWTEIAFRGAAPAARSNPSLAFDAARGTLFLFGGKTADGPSGDTWRYDPARNDWIGLESEIGGESEIAPSPRSSQGTGYDALNRRVYVVGGLTAQGPNMEIWDTLP